MSALKFEPVEETGTEKVREVLGWVWVVLLYRKDYAHVEAIVQFLADALELAADRQDIFGESGGIVTVVESRCDIRLIEWVV